MSNTPKMPDIDRLIERMTFLTDEAKSKPLHLVMYTDGGSVTSGDSRIGGSGIHGYFFHDEEVKHKSGCPKGYPTKKGYVIKRTDKLGLVPVVGFFDYSYSLFDKTNNYMELLAMCIGGAMVSKLDLASVTVYSDSKYVVDNTLNHLARWVADDFISNGKPLANIELWQCWYEIYNSIKVKTKLSLLWVKGHDGDIGNTLADTNATKAIRLLQSDLVDSLDAELIRADEPKRYFDREHELSPLLTERRLILSVNPSELPYYFQMTMGKRWASTEEERREQIGKRISDTLVSVVKLKQRDPLLTQIENICRQECGMGNVVVTRLDLLTQGDLYCDIKDAGYRTLQLKGTKVLTSDGAELVNELKHARLSWRIIPVFEELMDRLDHFLGQMENTTDDIYTACDITDQLFTISTNKKGETVYAFGDFDDDNVVSVKVAIPELPEQTIRLTGGVDLPSALGLKRLAKQKPKATLLTWRNVDHSRVIHYALIMETEEEAGIWMSAYANMHIACKDHS